MSSILPLCLAAAAALGAACSEEESAMIVTVKVRPSVVGAVALSVQLKNGAGIAGDELKLEGKAFPLTFSVSSPGRRGDLEIQVSALDDKDVLVGRGSAIVPIDAATGEVLVDSADFVVNTDFADDQFLTNDYESVGTQLAANSAGEWTASYRQRCTPAACNVFARRFDRNGQALTSGNSGSNAFTVNTNRVGSITSSAAAANDTATLLFWETTSAEGVAEGVACRSFGRDGTALAEKRLITEASTDVVVATALPGGNFAATWSGRPTTADPLNIRTVVVDPTCTLVGTLQPVGTLLPAIGLRQSAIAASGTSSYLIAWRSEDTIRARSITSATGAPLSPDSLLLTPPIGEIYSMVRLAANNNGYVMVTARRGPVAAGSKVSLELQRVTVTGDAAPALVGPPTLVTDKIDDTFDGFSVASHPLGPILVTWHACNDNGDGEGCGVFGRFIATNGTPQGEPFLIPTTTALDQTNASAIPLVGANGEAMFVVSWNDASTSPPDMGGLAVRARIVYQAQ